MNETTKPGTWWRYWQPRGAHLPPVAVKMPDGTIEQRAAVNLPAKFDLKLQSWDMAFGGTQKADFVVGQLRRQWGAGSVFSPIASRGLMDTLNAVWRRHRAPDGRRGHNKLVEDKANGPAVIQSLRHEIPDLSR